MKHFIYTLLFIILSTSYTYSNETDLEEHKMQEKFNKWVEDFKEKAQIDHKISASTLDKAFSNVSYKYKVVQLDRNQPEFKKTFWNYYDDAVHPLRVKRGKDKLKQYNKILKDAEKKYKVPSNIILAFWGMETDYGRNMGNIYIVSSLATLSFDHRRSKFFTNELIQALKIIDSKKLNINDLKGSWAGAFGNFQFIPSTFASYAVDGDGDGKIDLRNSITDAVYSAANYLSKIGWNSKYRWGRPVSFNKNNKKIWKEANSNEWKDIAYFSKLGVKRVNGNILPKVNIKAKLIAPMGIEGPVFLVYENFKCILRWNNSINYALSIGLLSDAIMSNKIGQLKIESVKKQ